MNKSACPTEAELREFVIGHLSLATWEQIADHLESCRDCETTLRSFDEYSDDLVGQLRQLPRSQTAAETADVPAVLIAQAKSHYDRPDEPSSSEVVVDPAQSITRQLREGTYRLGRFELIEQVGIGSFGHVFRAYDTELDRTVAVKIQRASTFLADADAERFLREARAAAQLHHPDIVALYETGRTEEGICYLVTEYIEGETLQARLERGRIDPQTAAEHTADLADALDYAHRHGVVHRDVKPSNIVIDERGQPHLMDFGLAKRESGETTMTLDGQVMGTPAYMSPEQAGGESHTVDARSDIYSLGVVLYEMLTGERPFMGNRRMLLLQVLEDDPKPPRQLNDQIPRDLETICLKAMDRSPQRRYASAYAMAEDLRRFLAGEPIQARPISPPQRLWRWCRRYPLAASLFLAVSFGSVAGLLYLSSLSEDLVEQSALDSARMQSEMLDEINSLYSETVEDFEAQTAAADQTNTTEADSAESSAISTVQTSQVPMVPARFTIEAGHRISQSESGMQVRLYSNDPFPSREDGGPPDDFGRRALAELEKHPDEPVYQFTEIEGRPVVRYATARVMTHSCINCHNEHPESPKTDWKEGDVRGVLEIIRPLDRDIQRTHDGLRGTFLWTGVTSLLLLSAGVLASRRPKSRSRLGNRLPADEDRS